MNSSRELKIKKECVCIKIFFLLFTVNYSYQLNQNALGRLQKLQVCSLDVSEAISQLKA